MKHFLRWRRIAGGLVFIVAFQQGCSDLTESKLKVHYQELNQGAKIIGNLNTALGEVVTIVGEVIQPRNKFDSANVNLKVLSIDGTPLKTSPPFVVLKPEFGGWEVVAIDREFLDFDNPTDSFLNSPDFRPPEGTILECVGYETGWFVGPPQEIYDRGPVRSTPLFHFRVYFISERVRILEPANLEGKIQEGTIQ